MGVSIANSGSLCEPVQAVVVERVRFSLGEEILERGSVNKGMEKGMKPVEERGWCARSG